MNETELKLVERSKILIAIQEKNNYREQLRKQVLAKIPPIPPEIQAELDSIDVEYETGTLQTKLAELEEAIKKEVLVMGKTVKVEGVGQAVFNKGRVNWETKGLEGLMLVIPDLVQFRKTGDPYITFR